LRRRALQTHTPRSLAGRFQGTLVYGQVVEYLAERLPAGQSQRRGNAFCVADDKALENVVHLIEPDRQQNFGVAVDGSFIFKIADTAARQGDTFEGEAVLPRRQAGTCNYQPRKN